MYGDSLTAGFVCGLTPSQYEPYARALKDALGSLGTTVEITGCGLCGLTAAEMAKGLDSSSQLRDVTGRSGPGLRRMLTEQGPFDLVLIMAGTNDIAMNTSRADDIVRSIKELHTACHALGTPTVLLSIPESCATVGPQFPEVAKKWRAVNTALATWVRDEEKRTSLCTRQRPFRVDAAQLLPFNQTAQMRNLWEHDGLHFSKAGSREFGSQLASLLVPLLSESSVSRQTTPLRTSESTSNVSVVEPEVLRKRSKSPQSDSGDRKESFRILPEPSGMPLRVSPRYHGASCGFSSATSNRIVQMPYGRVPVAAPMQSVRFSPIRV